MIQDSHFRVYTQGKGHQDVEEIPPILGFVLALFTIAKQRKHPRISQPLEKDNMVHTRYRVWFSRPLAAMWMKLEDTVLRERSQSQKSKCCLLSVTSGVIAVILAEAESTKWIARMKGKWGEAGNWGPQFQLHRWINSQIQFVPLYCILETWIESRP